jgi:hypothetical protein
MHGRDHSKDTPVANLLTDLAAFGSLSAGAVAIIKALEMERTLGSMLFLTVSLAACGLVCYLYFRRD